MRTLAVVIVIIAILLATSIHYSLNVVGKDKIVLNGAGATFPFPLISKWAYEYSKMKPDVTITYQPIGSGGGISEILRKTVDFGATDAPLSDDMHRANPGILHIPETLGGVAIIYNLPENPKGLRLTGEVLAKIYLGEIVKWNDPEIVALNPTLQLPNEEIRPIFRADRSGTTFVLTDYLSNVSSKWRDLVGKGMSVKWSKGAGAKGNEGVSGYVKRFPYSIGYVELAYAKKENIAYAFIKNSEGNFIEPSAETISAAVASFLSKHRLPRGDESWSKVSVVNAPGPNSYPIVSLTYLLIWKDQEDPVKGKALVEFIWWAVTIGQKYAEKLGYAPLPHELIELNKETLKLVNYDGKPLAGG